MKVLQDKIVKDGLTLNTLEVKLENTTLLLLEGHGAFFMCGALDPAIYKDREVICGRAVNVKTLDQLLEKELFETSTYAKNRGITAGMTTYEAFKALSKEE